MRTLNTKVRSTTLALTETYEKQSQQDVGQRKSLGLTAEGDSPCDDWTKDLSNLNKKGKDK